MPRTAPAPAPFLYVESDVPTGQTLVEWRHERILEQAAGHHSLRRSVHRLVHRSPRS